MTIKHNKVYRIYERSEDGLLKVPALKQWPYDEVKIQGMFESEDAAMAEITGKYEQSDERFAREFVILPVVEVERVK